MQAILWTLFLKLGLEICSVMATVPEQSGSTCEASYIDGLEEETIFMELHGNGSSLCY